MWSSNYLKAVIERWPDDWVWSDYIRGVLMQVSVWSNNYLKAVLSGEEMDPGMDKLMKWLPKSAPHGNQPTCELVGVARGVLNNFVPLHTGIVHGDYRIENMVFHPTEVRGALKVRIISLPIQPHPLPPTSPPSVPLPSLSPASLLSWTGNSAQLATPLLM